MESSAQVPTLRTLKTRAMGRKKLPSPVDVEIPRHHRIANQPFRRLGQGGRFIALTGLFVVAAFFAPNSLSAFAIYTVFAGLVGKSLYSTRKFNKKNAVGLELLKGGKPKEALELFEPLTRKRGTQKQVAVYNTGVALLADGQIAQALAHFVETSSSFLLIINVQAPAHIALCYGLLGDTHAAEAWLKEFDARTKSPNRAHLRFLKTLAEAVVHLRQGGVDDTMALFDEQGRAVAGHLATVFPGVTETVWAYVLSRVGRESDKRYKALVADLDADADMDRLRRVFDAWPEVLAFLKDLEAADQGAPVTA